MLATRRCYLVRMRYAAFRKHSIMSHAHEICGAHHIIKLWCTRDFMLCARHNFCQVSLKTSVMNVVLKVFEPLYKKFREVLHTSIPFNSYCMNLTTPPPSQPPTQPHHHCRWSRKTHIFNFKSYCACKKKMDSYIFHSLLEFYIRELLEYSNIFYIYLLGGGTKDE